MVMIHQKQRLANPFPQQGTVTPYGIVLDDPTLTTSTALSKYADEQLDEYQLNKHIGEDMWDIFRLAKKS